MKRPCLLCDDETAVATLVGHRYFQAHVAPLQLFNRATDPFVPGVRQHTHSVLEKLDRRCITNHVLVITRARLGESDMERLEALRHLRVTLLVTYSGIQDARIEPIAPSGVTVRSIRLACRLRRRTKVVVYWRPIVPGWNDDDAMSRGDPGSWVGIMTRRVELTPARLGRSTPRRQRRRTRDRRS
jgi:hypothetical protein